MHRLTIYNHKGGVGKTTLTVNIAAALAELGKTVLLVDTDPQCNLTSYLLADDVVDSLLTSSDSEDGETVWTIVKPIFDGTGAANTIPQIEIPTEAGQMFLIPGDIRMSEFELFLGDAWVDCLKRRLGGLRATSAIHDCVGAMATDLGADFVFYDTGPNIGPLNRVLLLGSDFFVVPVACDLFSVRALSTLGQTLKTWLLDWQTIAALAPDTAPLLPATPRFLGYIPQRFKVYGQRMARAPSSYLHHIERRMNSDILKVLASVKPGLTPKGGAASRLGQVKEFGVVVQDAQLQGVPISAVAGANEHQRLEAWEAFQEIAENILTRTKNWPKS